MKNKILEINKRFKKLLDDANNLPEPPNEDGGKKLTKIMAEVTELKKFATDTTNDE
jgi:uncharacterized coiled-coil DUF342 family protein